MEVRSPPCPSPGSWIPVALQVHFPAAKAAYVTTACPVESDPTATHEVVELQLTEESSERYPPTVTPSPTATAAGDHVCPALVVKVVTLSELVRSEPTATQSFTET